MSLDDRLKALLERLARALVATPDQVEVRMVDGRRATRFELDVPEKDRGQLIGKEGITIRSVRTLVSIAAHKHRRRFEVEIPD
ncbi:MAG: KH domain-containing protein [Acidobacteriota bacterium]|nr:KH domain-containing protein [Acidobacteriota bacterium]